MCRLVNGRVSAPAHVPRMSGGRADDNRAGQRSRRRIRRRGGSNESPRRRVASTGTSPARRDGCCRPRLARHARADGASRRHRADGAAVRRPRSARFRSGGRAAHPPAHSISHRRQRQPDPGAGGSGAGSAHDRSPRKVCPPAARSATRSSTAATASPPPSSSRRSTRPARWRASSPAPSAPCRASAACACTWCCRAASRSPASGRTRRPASMLTMAGVGRLDREGVQAILNLVAAAVPGLRPQNIAIVDSARRPAGACRPAGRPGRRRAQSTEEVRRATELRLSRAVEEMLERSARRRPRPRRGRRAHELRQGAARPRSATIRTAR